MNRRFALKRACALFLALSIGLYGWPGALAQAQKAGQVTASIPAGEIARSPSLIQAAEVGADVLWDDLVTTSPAGRVRLTLEDGSILNVGSNSSLRVVQHDAATQQTDLILTLGQMRVRATKLSKPGSRFTIRTNTATLGVIGTDFWVMALGDRTIVIVFEGAVTVADIAAAIATIHVGPGQQVVVITGQPPGQPFPANPQDYQSALNDTNVGDPLPQPPGPRAGAGPGKLPVMLAIAGAVTILVVSLVVGKGHKESPPPVPPPPRSRDGQPD